MTFTWWRMEWNKRNEYNSFNSWKGLLYADWYKAIVKGEFLPPIEASLDPIHACNLSCEHCNANRYIRGDTDLKDKRMTDAHLDNLIDFLSKWGVKAICYGGGGEPTLHRYLAKALYRTKARGMEAAVATNGVLLNKELIRAMAQCCRWVGISVDAGTLQTYYQGKKQNSFDVVIDNIRALIKDIKETGSKCEVSYKFLIMPYNQDEISLACVLAKSIGVHDFHVRPADFRHQGMGELKKKNNEFNIENIKSHFESCHKIEDKDFRVFTVMHKFDENFAPRKDFSQCYAAPIVIQLCADGNVYFCVDQRHRPEYLLGTHYPDPANILNFWGSEKHKALVFNSTPKQCDTRCTFGTYCRQCERLFTGKDPMHWKFV